MSSWVFASILAALTNLAGMNPRALSSLALRLALVEFLALSSDMIVESGR